MLDLHDRRALLGHPRVGTSWEGFAIEQVLAAVRPADAYYWGTHGGAELDLFFVVNGRRCGVEVKFSDAPAITRSMRTALDDLALDHLWIVYPGLHRYPVDERITAWPLADIGGLSAAVRGSRAEPRYCSSGTGPAKMRRVSVQSTSEPAGAPSPDRLSFETLISDTSAKLLHVSPLVVGEAIATALCSVRTFFQADRCALLAVKADTPFVNVLVASYAEGVAHVGEEINLAELFPWTYRRLVVDRVPVFTRLDELPPEAALGMSENVFINIKNRSVTITADVDIPKGGANGVILAQGGRVSGFSLYRKGGKPMESVRCFDARSRSRLSVSYGLAAAVGGRRRGARHAEAHHDDAPARRAPFML